MFSEDQIHHELHLLSNREDENYASFNILTSTPKFKLDEELSQWRTSSYPTIPPYKKKPPFFLHNPSPTRKIKCFRDTDAPLLPEELSHRYTFLNQHSDNLGTQNCEQFFVKEPKNIELKLPKSLKHSKLPDINKKSSSQISRTKSKSFMDSRGLGNAPIYYVRHQNQVREKSLMKSMSKEIGEDLMCHEVREKRNMKRARLQKILSLRKKSQSKSPKRKDEPDAEKLKRCLIFSHKT